MHATLIDSALVFEQIKPKPSTLHKGTAGRVFLVVGSRAFRGAAAMASMGALRSGCGYITVASTKEVCRTVASHLVTPTFVELQENAEGRICADAADEILRLAAGYDVLLLGCGLGLDADTIALTQKLVARWEKDLVLDADGINAAAQCISILKESPANLILTPHEGEMARLLNRDIPWIHENRVQAVTHLAQTHQITTLLKGPHTLVASADGTLLENTSGNSGLAKAGSGDILSGMIASFAAQGLDPLWACACGAYLHGAASDRTAGRLSQYCMQPPDLLDDLPALFLAHGR